MALGIGQIRHVGLFTPDVERHARFYTDVWGLQQAGTAQDAVFLRGSSSEQFILGLYRRSTKGLHHIAYALPTDDAVLSAASELSRAGVRTVQGPAQLDGPCGGFGFRFIDPDGRCIEISSSVTAHEDGWQR